MDVVKETLNVAGLLTNVYALSDLRDRRSSEPVVVLFVLHGRGSSADTVDPTARAAFAWVAEKQCQAASPSNPKRSPRDFVVVTFVRGSLPRDDPRVELVRWLGPCGLGRTSGTTAGERSTDAGTWGGAPRRKSTMNAMRKYRV